eukprot:9900165-Karenia_brevis.AAC.1
MCLTTWPRHVHLTSGSSSAVTRRRDGINGVLNTHQKSGAVGTNNKANNFSQDQDISMHKRLE